MSAPMSRGSSHKIVKFLLENKVKCPKRTGISYSKYLKIRLNSTNLSITYFGNGFKSLQNKILSTGVKSERNAIHNFNISRTAHSLASPQSPIVFGIETSCDDTGAAVVDSSGNVLGDALNAQIRLHVKLGGILPPLAGELHEQNIEDVVQSALAKAKLDIDQVDAIAATVKPGLPLSLKVGLEHAKQLVRKTGKPFMPIHHMEAHALTARMIENIEFPYLTLLVSGGHCLLAVVKDVEDFILLGKSLDIAPGGAYDKVARRMKIQHIPEYCEMSGGRAIEVIAQSGDPKSFPPVHVLSHTRDCNFSFSGIRASFETLIKEEEIRLGKETGNILPNLADICASFQYSVLNHLAKRLQRAFLYCELHDLLPNSDRVLVLSGGVASNAFIRTGLEKVCSIYDCKLVCPPPYLCTDNGIMIAWNGVEKMKKGIGIVDDIDSVQIQHKCPLGEDWSHKVQDAYLKGDRIHLLE